LNKTFYHQTVTSKQVEEYINKNSGKNFSKVFDQYLRTTLVPTLEYKIEKGNLFYRWANVVKGFNMPLKIKLLKDKHVFIYPTEIFKQIKFNDLDLKVDENFYIKTKRL
jgi:aminopeptidase N